MEGAFDIPDPTDWLETPLKDFSSLENALHCDICKEFYDTPMITSCCHTFCSKCIRTCLSANGKCPSCQTADQASKLRNNWILQTVVEQFLAARPAALDVARREKELAEQAKKRGKRKRTILDSDDLAQAEQDGRTTRSKSRRIAASQSSQPEAIEIEDSDDEYDPEKEQDDGLVDCLFGCGKRIKPEEMDAHLDRCAQEQEQASRAKSRTPVNNLGLRPSSAQERRAPDRISELNSSLLTDTKLRQRLKDAGIPNWGTRQLMIKRHTEWVNLWNANCDSGGRKAQRDLLRDLEAWERTQGGRAPNPNGLSSTIMRKDFDGLGWASNNKQDFSRLIADAKRKKNNPAVEEERAKDVDMGGTESTHIDNTPSQSDLSNTGVRKIHVPPEELAPYENNTVALSSIRAKVEAANEGRHIEPYLNAGFESVPAQQPNGSTMAPNRVENQALPEQNYFGNLTDGHAMEKSITEPCSLSAHMSISSSPVKVPMFTVPQRPVSDVDAGGAEQGR